MNHPPPGPEEQQPPEERPAGPYEAPPHQSTGGPPPPSAGWAPPHAPHAHAAQPPRSHPAYAMPPGPGGWARPGSGPYPPTAQPTGPVRMPGTVLAARVLLFVGGGLYLLQSLLLFALVGVDDRPAFVQADIDEHGIAYLLGLATWPLLLGGLAVLAASLCGRGRRKVRVLGIVVASLLAFFGLGALGNGDASGLLTATLGVLAIIFLAGAGGRAWFTRPSS